MEQERGKCKVKQGTVGECHSTLPDGASADILGWIFWDTNREAGDLLAQSRSPWFGCCAFPGVVLDECAVRILLWLGGLVLHLYIHAFGGRN